MTILVSRDPTEALQHLADRRDEAWGEHDTASLGDDDQNRPASAKSIAPSVVARAPVLRASRQPS
jgi:hypothetical protein